MKKIIILFALFTSSCSTVPYCPEGFGFSFNRQSGNIQCVHTEGLQWSPKTAPLSTLQ